MEKEKNVITKIYIAHDKKYQVEVTRKDKSVRKYSLNSKGAVNEALMELINYQGHEVYVHTFLYPVITIRIKRR